MPKYVNDWAGVDGVWGRVGEREVRTNGREDSELNYQERVAVIWIEKVKSMGPGTLDGVERGRGCAQDRVILVDMSNIGIVMNWHFSRSFHFYFIALTLVVTVQSLIQTQAHIP